MTYRTQFAPQPKKSNTGKWIVAAIVGLLVLCGGGAAACVAVAGSAVNEMDNQIQHGSTEKAKDISGIKCERGSMGATVRYTVTNSSDRVQSYSVQFKILDGSGTVLDTANGFVSDLKPGQKASDKAMGLAEVPSGIKCQLDRVD